MAPKERDEVALAQALSNMCYQLCQVGELERAETAGRESMEIFQRLGHPRLGQAERHLAHVLKSQDAGEEALAMYKQSVATFERTGTSQFDTEYASSLQAVSIT